METTTIVSISKYGFLVIFIGYALYIALRQPSQQLRYLFEEHKD